MEGLHYSSLRFHNIIFHSICWATNLHFQFYNSRLYFQPLNLIFFNIFLNLIKIQTIGVKKNLF